MNTNKIASAIIITGLLISLLIIFTKDSKPSIDITTNGQDSNVEIKDGIQYITVNARGGYFPRLSSAKADIPTKLVVKTQGTYDCSAYLILNSLGYRSMLPSNGETIINVGIPEAGKSLSGTCGMGMYQFSVEFK